MDAKPDGPIWRAWGIYSSCLFMGCAGMVLFWVLFAVVVWTGSILTGGTWPPH